MTVSSVSYKNSSLWRKSLKLVAKTGSLRPAREEPHYALFVQFQKAIESIQQDIKEAYSHHNQQFVLYHFSKAKSSCLIAEEMLTKIGKILPVGSYSEYLESLDEMKSILDNYIHLSQINMVIEKKRKEAK